MQVHYQSYDLRVYISLSTNCHLIILIVFWREDISNVGKDSVIFFFSFSISCLWCYNWEMFALPKISRFFPVFSFRSFIFLGFTFKSMIYFDLIFVFGEIYGSKLVFSYIHPIIPATFVENTIHFLWNYICILAKNQLPRYVWFYLYTFYCVPLTYLPVIAPLPDCLCYCFFYN